MNWNSYITSKSFLIVVIVLQTFNRWSIIIPWIKFQWLQIFCNIEQDSWKPKKKCQNFYITLYPHCQFFVLIVTSKINFLEFNFNNLWQRIFPIWLAAPAAVFNLSYLYYYSKKQVMRQLHYLLSFLELLTEPKRCLKWHLNSLEMHVNVSFL